MIRLELVTPGKYKASLTAIDPGYGSTPDGAIRSLAGIVRDANEVLAEELANMIESGDYPRYCVGGAA